MQHFFKDYTTVPYVETVKIDDNKRNYIKDSCGWDGKVTYGMLDPELDEIELDL